jgi:hypothetical protein
LKPAASSRHPVFAAMRPAHASERSVRPSPPSSSSEPAPCASSRADSTMRSGDTRSGGRRAGVTATPSASFQAVSAGRISVATWPGACRAAAIAAAPSCATVRDDADVRTQCETGRAMPSMSEVSGASCPM